MNRTAQLFGIVVVAACAGAVIAGACGGIAVIDGDGDGDGGSASTTTTSTTTQTSSTGPAMGLCDACATAEIVSAGSVANVEITEASGIAASRVHTGVYYVHNDSGGAPRFFALDLGGQNLGSYVVNTAAAVDWEDIATGPCADGTTDSCVYLADIGDNAMTRGSYVIYRAREPVSISPMGGNVSGEAITFTYPDGNHNAEALIVDPTSGQLFIVTKTMGVAGLYRFPLPLTPGVQLERVGDVSVPGLGLVTGGSAHANGVLLRTYGDVVLYDQGMDVAQRLTAPGCAVSAPGELQGEAVEWHPDGLSYVTVAEGQGPPLYEMRCMR